MLSNVSRNCAHAYRWRRNRSHADCPWASLNAWSCARLPSRTFGGSIRWRRRAGSGCSWGRWRRWDFHPWTRWFPTGTRIGQASFQPFQIRMRRLLSWRRRPGCGGCPCPRRKSGPSSRRMPLRWVGWICRPLLQDEILRCGIGTHRQVQVRARSGNDGPLRIPAI